MSVNNCYKIPVIMINEFTDEELKVNLLSFGKTPEEALEKEKKIINKKRVDKVTFILDLYDSVKNPQGRRVQQTSLRDEFMRFKEKRKERFSESS